jgi:hypothetical protein
VNSRSSETPEGSRGNGLKFYWGMLGNGSYNPPGSCLVCLNRNLLLLRNQVRRSVYSCEFTPDIRHLARVEQAAFMVKRKLQLALFPLMSMKAVPFHANPKPKLPLNLSSDPSLGVRNLDT